MVILVSREFLNLKICIFLNLIYLPNFASANENFLTVYRIFSNSISISGQRANVPSILFCLHIKLFSIFVGQLKAGFDEDVQVSSSMDISELAAVEQQLMPKTPVPQSLVVPALPHPLNGFISFMTVILWYQFHKIFWNRKSENKTKL